jgi:DNA-binding response OmpR family regulator
MSVSYENDTANTTPVNGNMSLSQMEAIARDGNASAHPTGKPIEGHDLQCILVVEDDLTLATLEVEMLTAHGYTVVAVNSGEQAIASLRHSTPDLVVLDLELAGSLQGWDVLQALRTFATIPVLLTTSSATAVRAYIRRRGESRFTLDHLPKPYPMQTLLKRVKRMLMIAPQ